MSMPSAMYWQQRALQREARAARRSVSLTRQVIALYDKALYSLQQDIRRIVRSFSRAGGLTEDEARAYLRAVEDSRTLDALREQIQALERGAVRQRLLNRINAPAYRARLSRLQSLRLRIDVECARIAQEQIRREREVFTACMAEEYYRSLYDAQVGTGFGFAFDRLPSAAVEAALNHRWSGQAYSAVVWNNTHRLAKETKDLIQHGLLTGKSTARLTNDLVERMESGKYEAARVIRTELNHFHNEGARAAYREMGVTRYRYLATLDAATCAVCGALDGRVFPVAEAQTGVNYPPLHPNDRCTTTAVFDNALIVNLKRRARDPATGKTYLVPANTTYAQWRKSLADKHGDDAVKAAQAKRVANSGKSSYTIGRKRGVSMTQEELFSKIDDTEGYTPEYRAKMKETYAYFRDEGYPFREHALNRFLGQKSGKGKFYFSRERLLSVLQKEHNYRQKDGKLVRFYDELAVISAVDTQEVVGIVVRARPKTDWREYHVKE